MNEIVLTPVPVAELIDRIANEIEERMHKDTPPAPARDRITVEEAMAMTGLTRSSLYKMTMTRTIPFSKYGKLLVFSRQELQNWIDRRTVPVINAESEMAARLSKSASRKKR
jgi:excisionase family DNA binding protein